MYTSRYLCAYLDITKWFVYVMLAAPLHKRSKYSKYLAANRNNMKPKRLLVRELAGGKGEANSKNNCTGQIHRGCALWLLKTHFLLIFPKRNANKT